MSKVNKDTFYVDPDEMWDEFNRFYTEYADNPDAQMPESLGVMINDIATKLAFSPNFLNYSFRSEMIGDARVKMVKAVYDQNFKLWGTNFCTKVEVEGDRPYVIQYMERKKYSDNAWDDKRTYLKDWDVIEKINTTAMVIDPTWVPEECSDCSGKCKCQTHPLIELKTEYGEPVNYAATTRNNAFSYYTKIAYHAFVNGIKKEKKADMVLRLYQEKVYEDMHEVDGEWSNVKRQRLEDEENDSYDSANEVDQFYNEENAV